MSPFWSMEVVAHEVVGDQGRARFGVVEPCLCGLACPICIAPPYGLSNGRWESVAITGSREPSGRTWRMLCIPVIAETEFPRSLAKRCREDFWQWCENHN